MFDDVWMLHSMTSVESFSSQTWLTGLPEGLGQIHLCSRAAVEGGKEVSLGALVHDSVGLSGVLLVVRHRE